MVNPTAHFKIYILNGSFVETEPGENMLEQIKFRRQIKGLYQQFLDIAPAVYDVRIFNDRIWVYYIPDMIETSALDLGVSQVVAQAWREQRFSRKRRRTDWVQPGHMRARLIKRTRQGSETVSTGRQAKRLEDARG